MANPARELECEALKLSRRARARLAQRLISSLDQEMDADAEKLWLAEAERRLGELKSGFPPQRSSGRPAPRFGEKR